jgi:hypothetical protein
VTEVTVPDPLTGLACSVMAEPGVKISPAVGLVMDTMGAPLPVPPPPVEVGLGEGDGELVGEVDGDGDGDGDEVGEVEGDGLGDGLPLPLQAVPFRVKAVGAVLLPL